MAAAASLGAVLLWDVEGGLPQIDRFLYSPDNHVVAGDAPAPPCQPRPTAERSAPCPASPRPAAACPAPYPALLARLMAPPRVRRHWARPQAHCWRWAW
jgi:hypothetical protein